MKNIIALVLCFAVVKYGTAQRYFNNPISQYYRNDYLWNPANAGKSGGTQLYALMNRSFLGFEGAPQLISVAGDMHFGMNSGVGLQFVSDKSGVLQRDLGAIAYSYKVPLGNGQALRVGADLTLYRERLNSDAVTQSGQIDPTAASFNERKWDFDGDAGLAYESGGFTIGATGYNLRTYIQSLSNNPTDVAVAQFLSSYKFGVDGPQGDMAVTPMLAYKLYYNHENILTGGAQFEYKNIFHVSGYYQNTGNFMGGVGVCLKDFGEVNFFYSGKNKYSYNETYEIALKVSLKNKQPTRE